MKLDPAVCKVLSVDPATASVSSAGGGGMSSASTSKISAGDRQFFMKTGKGKEAKVMFEGEHASLNALHNAVPSLCPQSFGWGTFTNDPSTSFLVTSYLTLSRFSSANTTSNGTTSGDPPPTLAAKLARLHTTPAPPPPGETKPQFGFPVPTCCGDTPQDNTFTPSWSTFYANSRLRYIDSLSTASNGPDPDLSALVERTASEVVPRLIGDDHLNGGKGVTPVVVHGDLWSGNASKGSISGVSERVEDVVYDPSACYAHSEYEIGIMKMFGGFGKTFFDEYHRLCPKTEPVEEYEDRVKLYELYHHLNHHALFGGGYRSGAVGIMETLIGKYGNR
ncbi:Ketosamine-3-kinase [Saccharata proteae CBS 121410]|uniref:protein-ribulosamine 3-kinase n=1 Tax=Saccharata proteae CBS 121410 TaxID=1314787 RepID=A0A9P4I0T2_9PEZI|nr:Ketosamine-3-kinase [Saccharata proteae CBS 121410]